MAGELTYEVYEHERDANATERCCSLAFGGDDLDDTAAYLNSVGHENIRVVRAAGVVVSCVAHLPMGQYFGGRSVSMTGIAAVAVAPEARGRGVATFMMQESTKELHKSSAALGVLYASTQALYRKVGYEQAGHCFKVRLPLSTVSGGTRGDVRAFCEDDLADVKDCYARWAIAQSGSADRSEFLWNRIRTRKGKSIPGFVIEGPGKRIDGYLFARQRMLDEFGDRQELQIFDLCASTPDAALRVICFLGDFQTIPESALFHAGPTRPLLMLLDEQRYEVKLAEPWMTRVLNVPCALESRGYAPALNAEVHFEFRDDLVTENNGRFILRVAEGRGSVERGGEGCVRMDVRSLAPLYTGYFSASNLAQVGLIEGHEESLAIASVAFAGNAPCMSDRF